jgi:hypothetical protein
MVYRGIKSMGAIVKITGAEFFFVKVVKGGS